VNRSAVRAALAVCLAAALSACGPRTAEQAPPSLPAAPHPSAAGPTVAAVRRAGLLRVAVDLSVPPMAFRDDAGPRGFDVDLVGLIAQALGVRLAVTDTPLAVMHATFPAGADLAAGALSAGMVPGLATESYGETSPVIVWGPKTAGADLRALRGKRVAAALGSPGERLAREAGATLVGTYLPQQSLTAVAQGRVDAAIAEGPEALDFVGGAGSGAHLRTTPAGGPAVPLVLVARPGAGDLAAYATAVIRELRAQGGLDQLRRRWHL
jgi:polar amino acid transport system substrate-binding protein